MTMSKKERVRAALQGEPVDRVPVSLWGHDFLREWSPDDLVAATLESYRTYDWDFIKLNPRSTYFYEAWGNRFERLDAEHQPRLLESVVTRAADLRGLHELDPREGVFGDHLVALRRVVEETGGEVDVIATIFSPIGVVGRLGGREQPMLRQFVAEDSAAVHTGLATVTRTLTAYARAAIDAGATGIFLATLEFGSRQFADEPLYREFGRPYDLQLLDAVRDAPLNIMHVCRERNMMPLFLDYPVAALNWSDRAAGNPSLREVLTSTQRAVMGGIDERSITTRSAAEVEQEAAAAIAETGGRRMLLTGGCAIPPSTPPENRRAVVRAATRG